MKQRYSFFMLTLFAIILFGWIQQTNAQHTLVVPWDDGTGQVKINALYNAVMGDTNANGSRADLDREHHRVFPLDVGAKHHQRLLESRFEQLGLEQAGAYIATERIGFARHAVVAMKAQGIVRSVRGVAGGYLLARAPAEITRVGRRPGGAATVGDRPAPGLGHRGRRLPRPGHRRRPRLVHRRGRRPHRRL